MGNQASRQRQSSSQAGTAQAAAAPAPPAYAPGSGTPGPHYPPAFRPQVGIRTLFYQVETTRHFWTPTASISAGMGIGRQGAAPDLPVHATMIKR